jgi:hypothetical protein
MLSAAVDLHAFDAHLLELRAHQQTLIRDLINLETATGTGIFYSDPSGLGRSRTTLGLLCNNLIPNGHNTEPPHSISRQTVIVTLAPKNWKRQLAYTYLLYKITQSSREVLEIVNSRTARVDLFVIPPETAKKLHHRNICWGRVIYDRAEQISDCPQLLASSTIYVNNGRVVARDRARELDLVLSGPDNPLLDRRLVRCNDELVSPLGIPRLTIWLVDYISQGGFQAAVDLIGFDHAYARLYAAGILGSCCAALGFFDEPVETVETCSLCLADSSSHAQMLCCGMRYCVGCMCRRVRLGPQGLLCAHCGGPARVSVCRAPAEPTLENQAADVFAGKTVAKKEVYAVGDGVPIYDKIHRGRIAREGPFKPLMVSLAVAKRLLAREQSLVDYTVIVLAEEIPAAVSIPLIALAQRLDRKHSLHVYLFGDLFQDIADSIIEES